MMLRTPPPKKQRGDGDHAPMPVIETPPEHHHQPLAIYEDPPPSDSFLCTYQCRQMVKSDFLDALSNAEKQVRDYESKLEKLNENFIKAGMLLYHYIFKAERKKFRDQFLYTEQELAAAKGREQMLQEQLMKEVNDSQERWRKQLQSHSELEVHPFNQLLIDFYYHFFSSVCILLFTVTVNLNNSFTSFSVYHKDSFSIALMIEAHILAECHWCHPLLTLHLSCKIHLAFGAGASWTGDGAYLLSSSNFVSQISSSYNYIICHSFLYFYQESEVREARKLKSSHENIEILKEKLLEEKGRRDRAESELSKFRESQPSMKKLEDELSSWKLITKAIPGVSCPEDIPVMFASLQKEVIDSTVKIGEANMCLKQVEVALDAAQLGKQNAEIEAALANKKAEASKSDLKQLELMLAMVNEERDKLRNVVNEFKRPKTDEAGNEAGNEIIVQELESSLAKKDWFIRELESNLREQNEVNSRQHDEIKLLNERLNNEARRIKSLERDSDRLRSEISLLESKLGHGDYSAANTKVLRMVNTLAVDNEAKQTIEALQTELQRTKDKLQAMEELNSQSGDAGKLVDSYVSGKITQLKEQIATLEKREERYKTVFADRISVFRRACCELFGYKIVMDEHQRPNGIPVTRFTLQSIYAQNGDEKLEFEYESGNTNIMANNYTSQREISQQVEIFIRKMNSIPAFTANLTVESFNKRTLT
ncbi:LOW QUALITY PROTEIN: MAD domain-containing protein [Cephalotus follicularis]|uniref:MAD domain-containing protein n=1 Tax=Cephalotus follicularis TaxID=3775 RepID=A0A1Q3B5Z1_CEPFO|nr:LOW QUALITY PROTEIN: MAD domain-containing protein [Cephalotus follicularis]